jgi:hypothetical protein
MSSKLVTTTNNQVRSPAYNSSRAIHSSLDVDSTFVLLCRAIATVGGGFAFGWSLRGWLGSLIGAATGLAAFALAQKNHR